MGANNGQLKKASHYFVVHINILEWESFLNLRILEKIMQYINVLLNSDISRNTLSNIHRNMLYAY